MQNLKFRLWTSGPGSSKTRIEKVAEMLNQVLDYFSGVCAANLNMPLNSRASDTVTTAES